jgi:hypothetical protein
MDLELSARFIRDGELTLIEPRLWLPKIPKAMKARSLLQRSEFLVATEMTDRSNA